jgi:acetoin utilization deacetylase AcuC-like enzyme
MIGSPPFLGYDPSSMSIPVFFHDEQRRHKPLYEWAFGDKLNHPETSHRAEKILEALVAEPSLFSIRQPMETPLAALRALHDPGLLKLLEQSEALPEGETFHPSVFPRSAPSKLDPSDIRHAGYYCFDSGTPLTRTTWRAALWSAACAEFAAREVVERGERLVYALSRPPGHHAAPASFGGYCYFNNAAIAAMKIPGKVALIDIDFHHGNGTQEIFYEDERVFFASIHGDPREFYPYYWGFAEERGRGAGEGFTMNVPLPRGTDGPAYLDVIERQILPAIRSFGPAALVISAGFDTFVRDPIGDFEIQTSDFHELGARFGRLGLPTVVVQEGGYWVDELGLNVAAFLRGAQEEIGRTR